METKRKVTRRRKKADERTAAGICRELLGRTLPAGAARLGVLEPVARALEQEQGGQADLYQMLLLVQLDKAMEGDTRAATFLRDCVGDKPEARRQAPGLAPGDRALLEKLWRRLEKGEAGHDR